MLPVALLAAASLAASPIVLPDDPPGPESGQIFHLQDYRWVPVIVRRIPTVVAASFQVVAGEATVHAELLTEDDFLQFRHHRDYEALAQTGPARSGEFHQMVETPGRYRVVIMNAPGAPRAAVSLVVRETVDPPPSTMSVGISPRRQFFVIFAGLTFFFGTVSWSGHKLLRAWRSR